MKTFHAPTLGLTLALAMAVTASAQVPAQPASGPGVDVYHVQFAKATPGESAALAKALLAPDPTAPMPGHVVVLRHQLGDDWDYCIIEHLGTKATIDAAAQAAAANPARPVTAWHGDTFVAGPPWEEFARAMGVAAGAGDKGASVYSVAAWRSAAGQREKLLQFLTQADANAKVPVGRVVLQHLEGGPWTYLAIERYNSWSDFGTAQGANASDADGWGEIRKYATYHHDTVAVRISSK